VLFESFPLAEVTTMACTLCVVLFFVTSSDSASLVVDTIASGGKENPPVGQRIFWATLEGVVAAVLLLAGGLMALRTAAITTALPFCLVIIAMCVSLVRALRKDRPPERTST
jgi:choline/glycine/proline betaine transport protein